MKHTKGPSVYDTEWRATQSGSEGWAVFAGPFMIASHLTESTARLIAQAPDRLASARAIMQKFVDKVDRGMARSIETYAEMKQWMEVIYENKNRG